MIITLVLIGPSLSNINWLVYLQQLEAASDRNNLLL